MPVPHCDACLPVDADTPACLGSNESRPDPGNADVRYPVGCHITYPDCDHLYGVPYDCTCTTDIEGSGGAPEWWCPV